MCCTYWCTAYESKISLTYLQYIQFFSSCCSAVWKCEKLCATDGRWHAHFPSVCFLPLLILESTIPAKSLSVEKDCLALGNSGTKMPVFCLPNWFTINFKNSWINSLSSERGKELVWNCQLEIQWFGNSEFQNESFFFKKNLASFVFQKDAYCLPKLFVWCFIRTVRHEMKGVAGLTVGAFCKEQPAPLGSCWMAPAP